MTEDEFLCGIAEIIRSVVRNPQALGRARRMARLGHLNYREFSPQRYVRMRLPLWLRVMRNLAPDMLWEEFREVWMQLGRYIYDAAEQHGDELNEEHRRKLKIED